MEVHHVPAFLPWDMSGSAGAGIDEVHGELGYL
jgi:hypothetical protein